MVVPISDEDASLSPFQMVSSSTNFGCVLFLSTRLRPRSSRSEEEASDCRCAIKCRRHVSDSATASDAIEAKPFPPADRRIGVVAAATAEEEEVAADDEEAAAADDEEAAAAEIEAAGAGKKPPSREGEGEGEADLRRP